MTRTGSLRFVVAVAGVAFAAGCATTKPGDEAQAASPTKVYRYAESAQPLTGSRIVRRIGDPGVLVYTDEDLQNMRGISLGAKLSGGGGTNGQF